MVDLYSKDICNLNFFSFQNLAGREVPKDTDTALPKDVIEGEEDYD